MEFSKEFFEGEEREGFYVEELMKRAWAAQLEVLSEVARVCKKYKITWYADSGTLLGAARHKGFIPWDDDLDIHMLRADYNKFVKTAYKALPEGYVTINIYTDPNDNDMLTRISNLSAPNNSPEILEKYHGFPYPCGLDITPVDYVPRDPNKLLLYNSLIDMCLVLANVYDKGEEDPNEMEDALKQVEEFTSIPIDRAGHIPNQLRLIADKVCGMYTAAESDVMGYAIRQKDYPNYNWPKGVYNKKSELPFENIMISVPGGYDQILTNQYGAEYMTPQQIFGHDYPFYKKWL